MSRLISYLLIFVLLCGRGFCQTPQELQSFLPEVKGWKIDKETEVFNSDNLFNRINGSAPLFIENNFREMTSLKYVNGKNYIVIQAYRHATPEDAFGMYASERSPDMAYYDIGGEAQGDDMNLYFFAGSIYVKMQSNEDAAATGVAMREIGKGLTAKIDSAASYPAVFEKFPNENKQKYSESYIVSGFLGHEFLHSVYSCRYDEAGKTLQLFVIDGKTVDGAKEILSKYFAFTKQTQTDLSKSFVITDKYNGDMPCIVKGQYIIGVYDESNGGRGADLLNKVNF